MCNVGDGVGVVVVEPVMVKVGAGQIVTFLRARCQRYSSGRISELLSYLEVEFVGKVVAELELVIVKVGMDKLWRTCQHCMKVALDSRDFLGN